MISLRRFATSLALAALLSLAARAQTPRISTVNITPEADRVRVSAVGEVSELRFEVLDESGAVVFESGVMTGDTLDWNMRDSQGDRVAPGTYVVTASYRTAAGKLRKRVEQVLVTEDVTAGDEQAKQSGQGAPAPSAPVEGAGTAGKLAKFTAANTLGNSVVTESAGRIGVNNAAPPHALAVNGGPTWTSSGWVGSIALPNAGAVGWAANSAGQRRGLGHNNLGLFFFRTASNPGAATSPAVFDMVITNAGNVGVGTNAPASKLTVNGTVQLLGAGSGIKFPDGSIQTKATSGTINGAGTANRLAKFTGPNSFGNSSITEVSGKVGIGTATPGANLHVLGTVNFTGLRTEAAPIPNVIGGFEANAVTAGVYGATIGGGGNLNLINSVGSVFGTVGGGAGNRAGLAGGGTDYTTVAGGNGNTASGQMATVGGGALNTASGAAATVGGGNINAARGSFSTVPGGFQNFADGQYSFAAGQRAWAEHGGSFVWSDSTITSTTFKTTAPNQFLINATGGVGIGTNAPLAKLEIRGGADSGGNDPKALAFSWHGGGFRHFVRTRHNASAAAGNSIDFFVNNSGSSDGSSAPGTGNLLVMSLDGGGRAGIGTDAPTFKLHVIDSSNTGLRVQTDAPGGTVASFGGNGDFRVDAPGIVGGRLIVKGDSSGNVGIGTPAPLHKLHVNGMVAGVGPYVDASDLRYKRDVRPVGGALSKVLSLRGVTFDWRREEFPALSFAAGRGLGFVAQEVERVVPEAVTRDSEGMLSVAYSHLTPVLVEAVKEQQAQIKQLQELVARQQSQLQRQQAQLDRVRRAVRGRAARR